MSFVQVIGLTEWRIVGAEKGIDEVMWPSEGGRGSKEYPFVTIKTKQKIF